MNEAVWICVSCGAPMSSRRKCVYCGTEYYTGPDIPEHMLVPLWQGQMVSDTSYLTNIDGEWQVMHFGLVTVNQYGGTQGGEPWSR